MAPSTSPELLAYREARARHLEALSTYDDDRLDLMCEARAVCVRLSGRRDLSKVPAHVEGQHVSLSVLMDMSSKWRAAVPDDRSEELDAAWGEIKAGLAALRETLHDLEIEAYRIARKVRDVLTDDTDDTKWRIVKYRSSDGSSEARGSATYNADDLIALGYDAAVVHRYRGANRRTFEVWARCTEEGARIAQWQRPDVMALGLWHQLHVPLVDVSDDAEVDVSLIEARLARCLALRQRDAERFAGTSRVP